jgi:chemotaxis protein CheZ
MPHQQNAALENELRKIADYIVTLRREIAVLQANDMHMEKLPAAGQELAEVVTSTEGATNEIMAIAEKVLSADASDAAAYKALVDQEMMALFEKCAFQDITGQRISRVVKTLEQIENRVSRFATYTGVEDAEGFANESEAEAAARKQKLMLNGPSIADDGNTQSSIDELLERLRSE